MDKANPPPYSLSVQSGLPPLPPRPEEPPPSLPRPMSDREYRPPKLGWCEDSQRNKPQSNSLAAAVVIFASGGMNLAWSLGFSPIYSDLSEPVDTHLQICWFLAVIIGACLGTVLVEFLEKRILNCLGCSLVLINGILFTSAPASTAAIIIARYCDGVAVGLTIITAIVAGSEQAVKRFRGIVLLSEPIGLMTGIMLKTIFTTIWQSNWDVSANRMQGIIAIVLGLLGFMSTYFLTIESPVFYLRRKMEQEAINSLKRLQTPNEETHETYSMLYENRDLLKEDINRGHLENMVNGFLPMIKLCVYRAFVAMSFSLPLNWGLLLASTLTVEDDRDDENAVNDWWSSYIYGIMRITGVVVAVFTVDTIGRREPTAIAMLAGGGLLMGVGSIFAYDENLMNLSKVQTIIALLAVYQFLSGIAAPASTVYLGEAFSISVKPFFIMVAVIFENIVQIIICSSFGYNANSMKNFSYTLGALQIVFAICFVIIMPETKHTTLREALNKFQRKLNIIISIVGQ